MSTPQSTPRKRKFSADGEETPRAVKGKGRAGPPTPNPPLVPFPTPPASRTRRSQAKHVEPSSPLPEIASASSSKQLSADTLPPHLQTLLNLHRSFNLALSLYIATHPPVLPPHPPTATSVQLPNLTNFLALRETVERTSGRRFGLQELARLAWVWTWDGQSLPNEKVISERNKQAMIDEDNPFLVSSPSLTTGASANNVGTGIGEVFGLSYLITPTRTLDPNTGRRVYTHGLGIELELRQGETRQILHGGAEGGLGNKGQGGGVGAIGRWNVGGEAREEAFREKLNKWVELNGGYEPPPQSILPTPTTSDNSRSSIPPIPILSLPHLPTSTLLPAANLFSAFAPPGSSSTLTPKKNHPAPSTDSPKTAGLADPFEMQDKKDAKGKVIRPGSVEERRQAMMDRIKARSGGLNGGKSLSTLGSSSGGFGKRSAGTLSAAGQQEELKRRSTLSRLESIAEGVWMMFSAPSPGPSTLPTAPRGRRKAIPMAEVADVIVKSSKTPISTAEAQTSLVLLTELCPFFLTVRTIGRQEWLEMPSTLMAPASPGSGSIATSSNTVPPAFATTSVGGKLAPGLTSPSTPGRVGEIAGPASPGRVRRVGGLREVRERIRRALGE